MKGAFHVWSTYISKASDTDLEETTQPLHSDVNTKRDYTSALSCS